MANFSDHSRKQQVYFHLLEHENEWVDGPDLANERIGGSEGLKRLRELRQDLADSSYTIQMRAHPDADRDIYQYRIVRQEQPRSVYAEPAPAAPMQVSDVLPSSDERSPERLNAPDRRGTHLAYDPVTDTYLAVNDAPAPELDPPPLPGQTDMGVPEEEGHKYTSRPSKLVLGVSIVCPMCNGIRRKIKEVDPVTGKATKYSKVIGYDETTRDPRHPSKPCPRCNGFGLIPNG
jgi:hypothetical protein